MPAFPCYCGCSSVEWASQLSHMAACLRALVSQVNPHKAPQPLCSQGYCLILAPVLIPEGGRWQQLRCAPSPHSQPPFPPRCPCRRPGCTFTFKNKCDIEKHKSYHIKDDAYAKDGFKKFYKYEECKYEGCVYSKATNHFHCIRAGCGFTFTSTSQMTSHKRKHERRHIRSSGVLGLPASLLGSKDNEQEESSNDDLIDFSAMSSKNSSLSASPTSQQSSVSLIVPAAPSSGAELASSQASKSANSMTPATKISGLLSQALPSNIPLALALSNSALPGTAGSFFPIIPSRVSTPLPASSANLMTAGSSGTNPTSSAPVDSSSQAISGSGEAAATSSPAPAASIMERISASKGLISPMMARLAAAALKPSVALEAGELPSSDVLVVGGRAVPDDLERSEWEGTQLSMRLDVGRR